MTDALQAPAVELPVSEDDFVWKLPTREGWLRAAAVRMAGWLPEVNESLNPDIAPVSCGFPKGRHGAGRAIGECYHPGACPGAEHLRPIFICPTLEKPTEVLATLLHELVHAALPKEVGHKKRFKDAVFGLGLSGKATATFCEPGSDLEKRFDALVEELGPYPHSAMGLRRRVKKGLGWPRFKSRTRPEYKVLVSPKMLAEYGPPMDPWGVGMIPNEMTAEDWDAEWERMQEERDEERRERELDDMAEEG